MIEFGLLMLAYGIGTVPVSWLVVRLLKWDDLRLRGTGRVGVVNVLRVAGLGIGLLAAVLEVGQGALAVGLAQAWWPAAATKAWGLVGAGLLALLGAQYPVFWRFKHGSTGLGPLLGAALVLWPWGAVGAGLIGAVVALRLRHSSVGAVLAASLFAGAVAYRAFFLGGPQEPVVFGLLSTLLVAWPYRQALQRWRKALH